MNQQNTICSRRQVLVWSLTIGVLHIVLARDCYAQPSVWEVNGHAYEFISSTLSWTQAKQAAESHSFMGVSGYLTTITSQAEQDFLIANFGTEHDVWLGANDTAVEGEWRWVTGDEGTVDGGQGLLFWIGGFNGTPVAYANWLAGEPNNLGNEDYLSWNHFQGGMQHPGHPWNDFPVSTGQSTGYFVEYTPSFLLGDVNLDGVVNLLDVQPFVDILTAGGFQVEADVNGDGVVDLLDVAPFVDLLNG